MKNPVAAEVAVPPIDADAARPAPPAVVIALPVVQPSHPPSEAELTLGFARDGATTRLVERTHVGPLRVQKALYPEGPALCHAVIVHPPGGVVGGDCMRIVARVEAQARALLTTPGAAKWYRANGRRSQQSVRLQVEAGASLEWLPQETIFFNGADVRLDHAVTLADDAAYIGSEILCFGRTAAGESFDAGQISQRTTIRRGAHLLWFEQGVIAAGTPAMQGALGLAGNTVCATLIAVGNGMTPALVDALRASAAALPAGAGAFGVSLMKTVLVARYLGNSSAEAKRLLAVAWAGVRPLLVAREAAIPRIWNT